MTPLATARLLVRSVLWVGNCPTILQE